VARSSLPEDRPGLRFYPDYFFEVLVLACVAVELVLVCALVFPAILGRRIDLVGQFVPRPEWYFLWLYEIVKYFPGRTAVLGTVVIPALAALIFLAFPWIDRDGRSRFLARSIWFAMLLCAGVFTMLAMMS